MTEALEFFNRKAKFDWTDDYYHSKWTLVEFEGEPDYDIAPGFEMPAEFVHRWAKAHKAVEALEDELIEPFRVYKEAELAKQPVYEETDY